MLGPKPDLHEAVMNELDYLRAYARENGEAAAWRNAADEIVKLRRYADEAKTRLAEVEAQVATMRSALEAWQTYWDHFAACGCHWQHTCDERARLRGIADGLTEAALSSSAGRETAERLRLLEELLDLAAAFTENCAVIGCHSDTNPGICYDACLRKRLRIAVRKLKGGDADAGTKA